MMSIMSGFSFTPIISFICTFFILSILDFLAALLSTSISVDKILFIFLVGICHTSAPYTKITKDWLAARVPTLEITKDWLAARVPTLAACKGSRLKLVGLDALPTYKRMVAWFPGPVEDAERYLLRLRRLNWGVGHQALESVRAQGGVQWGPTCAQYRHSLRYCVGETGMEALQWCGAGHILSSGHQAGGEEIRR